MNRAEQLKEMNRRINKFVSEVDEAIEKAKQERTILNLLEWKTAAADNYGKLENIFRNANRHNENHIPYNMMKLKESMDYLEESWGRLKDKAGREVE